MSERIEEILSWYRAESPGTIANLARILHHGSLGGTGRLVILPVDQGFEHGPARSFAPNPAAYDPRYHLDLAVTAGCNAYAAPLGFLEAAAAEFPGRNSLILKLNSHDPLFNYPDPVDLGHFRRAIEAGGRDSPRLPAEVCLPVDLRLSRRRPAIWPRVRFRYQARG